jgi:hypothetical protein
MFIADSRVLGLPVHAAQPRLENLVRSGSVSSSAAAAYASGIARVIRVGPFGDVPGAAKLVRVQFTDARYHEAGMTLGMRWEALGAAGGLFPVLDADISLTSEGETTRLALVGSYRPPFSWLGAGLDRALLRRVAMATIRALLRDVARSLADPRAAQAQADRRAGLAPAPLAEPETS